MKNRQLPTYRRGLQQGIHLTVTGSSYLLQWHGRNDLFQGRLGCRWLEKGERHWWSKQNSVHASGFTFCTTTGFLSNITITAKTMRVNTSKWWQKCLQQCFTVWRLLVQIQDVCVCSNGQLQKRQWSSTTANLQASSNCPISLFKINCQHKP